MSDTIPAVSIRSARAYNKDHAARVIAAGLPELTRAAYGGLTSDAGSEDFARAVFAVQKDLGLRMDGMLGAATYAAILREHDTVPEDSDYIVRNGRRFRVYPRTYKLICFDRSDDLRLDLHPAGHFSPRVASVPINTIVMHWGGYNPRSLYNVMSADRPVSTHFGIGLDEGNQPTVYQYLDIKHKAWHAGGANEGSIGIDICQQPVTKHLDQYKKAGYRVRTEANTTGRGNDRVLSLDHRIAAAANEFVQELARVMQIELRAPASHDVLPEDVLRQYSLLGHHHVSANKWDIACWWSTIFAGTQHDIRAALV
jgi:hypothetical protein